MQHEPVRNAIHNQKLLPTLIGFSQKSRAVPKELLLECLWTLSFDERFARQFSDDLSFVLSLQNTPKVTTRTTPLNMLRRSNSFSSRRTSNVGTTSNDATVSDGIHRMVDGLLWQLVTSTSEIFVGTLHPRLNRVATSGEKSEDSVHIVRSSRKADRSEVQIRHHAVLLLQRQRYRSPDRRVPLSRWFQCLALPRKCPRA